MIISREKAGFEHDEEAMNAAVREDIMLHAYMLTQSGIPMLYSGDELGQVNDYSYKNDPEKCADSRYIHRGKLPWELAEDKEDVTTVQGNIFQTLDRLEKIRRQEITFDKDADVYTYDVHDDSILCVLREYKGRRFFGIFNFSNQEKTAWMQEKGMYRNLLTGEKTDGKRKKCKAQKERKEKETGAENLCTGCSDKRTCDYYNDGPAFVSYTED